MPLSDDERDELTALIRKGKPRPGKLTHARRLRDVDESASGSGRSDEQTAPARQRRTRTLERVRERWGAPGLATALLPQPRPRGHERVLDGAQEAPSMALACSAPPEGKSRGMLARLAEPALEFGHFDW